MFIIGIPHALVKGTVKIFLILDRPLLKPNRLCYDDGMNTFERIYEAARSIPFGKVATYGQLARLAGNPRMARVVGYAMHAAPDGVPCHRVVSRLGELSPAFSPCGRDTHRLLLEMEGVGFLPDGRVNLKRFQWNGPDKISAPQD